MENKDKNIIEKVTDDLKATFTAAGSELSAAAKETADELRDGINAGRKALGDAYGYVEEKVGKDRIAGAAIGAKIGGLWGVRGGLFGIGLGGVVGAGVGFVAGRKLFQWLDNGVANDNNTDPQNKPKAGPDDPSPRP